MKKNVKVYDIVKIAPEVIFNGNNETYWGLDRKHPHYTTLDEEADLVPYSARNATEAITRVWLKRKYVVFRAWSINRTEDNYIARIKVPNSEEELKALNLSDRVGSDYWGQYLERVIRKNYAF